MGLFEKKEEYSREVYDKASKKAGDLETKAENVFSSNERPLIVGPGGDPYEKAASDAKRAEKILQDLYSQSQEEATKLNKKFEQLKSKVSEAKQNLDLAIKELSDFEVNDLGLRP